MQHFDYYVAEVFVIGGIASAAVIAADLRSCRQGMRIMNSVWILTGLWASFFGLWAYFTFGRTRSCLIDERSTAARKPGKEMPGMSMEGMQMEGMQMDPMPAMGMKNMPMDGMPGMPMDDMPGMRTGEAMEMKPRWQSVTLSTLHCGAGCTLADLVGEWALYFMPVAIGGSLIAGSWVVDYLLALLFGIGFQYAAIRGMQRTLPRGEAIRRAAKADILSLTAWQVGMYAWMAVVIFAWNDGMLPARNTFYFWFMMQIAMACGFLVALPVNVLLIRSGIKRAM